MYGLMRLVVIEGRTGPIMVSAAVDGMLRPLRLYFVESQV
jgi:hypothetical protein